MDIQVPLNNLKFGQDVGDGINARVSGRLEGIEALAANIFARGLIENLVVFHMFDDVYGVSNGNRRLAALHQIHGADSDKTISCTLREVDEAGAFEDSLTTAVLAQQLHPVDQYEAFARLKDRGQDEEEIARRYGMTVRQVEQALALGHLSPIIRQAWRAGEIKAEAARSFTLAADHARQDKALADLREDFMHSDIRYADGSDVKRMLQVVTGGAGVLVEFVGIDAYVARGGEVTRDLFGTDHQLSDVPLAELMAAEKLDAECAKLVAGGWAFAVPFSSVRNVHYNYGHVPKMDKTTDAEKAELAQLKAVFEPGDEYGDDPTFAEMTPTQQAAYLKHRSLTIRYAEQSYSPKEMKKGGCFVDVDDNGHLSIIFGRTKPVTGKGSAPATGERTAADSDGEAGERTDRNDGAATVAEKADPTAISNALRERLIAQLTHGTRDAVLTAIEDPDLIASPIAVALAKIVVSQINADQPHHTPHAVMTKMHAIRESLPAGLINSAILKRFDAADYFGSAPKAFVLKAIGEAINNDEARKVASKAKAEIGKFALANIGNKLGWVPKEMRSAHYVGPKVATAAPAKSKSTAKPVSDSVKVDSKAKVKPAKVAKAPATKKTVAKKAVAKKPATKLAKKRKS